MADNITLDVGSGGDVVAADDIGGVKYARNKITLGADGVNDGDISSSNPMPVKGTGAAGTADAGVVTVQGIASMTPVIAKGPGAAGTADTGVLTVQGIASMTPIQVGDNSASLTVDNTDITASAVSLAILDDWDESDRAKVNLIAGQAGVAGGSGVDAANVIRVALITDVGLPTGSNQIGKLATNNGVDIGDVTINNASGASAVHIQDGGNVITVDGTVTAVSGTTVTEDVASAGGESLTLIGGTRNDSAVSQTSQNGDYGTFAIDAAGRMGIADLGGSITVDNGGTFAVQATLQAGSASIGVLGANSGVDIGDVTINNASGGSAVNVQDGGNSLTVDAPVGTPAFVRLSDGAAAITTLPVSIAAGASTIGKAEDVGFANADVGVPAMAIQRSSPSATSITEDDYAMLQMHNGRLWVSAVIDTALPAGTSAIGKLAANSGVDIGDVDVTSIAAGTNTIGNVGLVPRTSGGLTIYNNIDLDETDIQVKGSAGQVYWIHAMNMSNIPLYLKFWDNLAASVTVGATAATMVIPLPTQGNTNGAGTQINIPQGLAFSTGITIAAVTGVGTAASTGPGANEVVVSLGYA